MDHQEQERIKQRMMDDMENITLLDAEKASTKSEAKIEQLSSSIPKALLDIWEDVKTIVSMLKDHLTGRYPDLPWKTVAAISTALLYFVSPIDIIPDFIFVAGYVDDAFVLKLTLDWIQKDLAAYRKWKELNWVDGTDLTANK